MLPTHNRDNGHHTHDAEGPKNAGENRRHSIKRVGLFLACLLFLLATMASLSSVLRKAEAQRREADRTTGENFAALLAADAGGDWSFSLPASRASGKSA